MAKRIGKKDKAIGNRELLMQLVAMVLGGFRGIAHMDFPQGICHIFMHDDCLVFAVEHEGCGRVSAKHIADENYEALCIHLITEGFMSPTLELIASAVTEACANVRLSFDATLPEVNIPQIESPDKTTTPTTIDI